MADKTVYFTGTVLASVPQNLYYRINVIFAAGGNNPAAGSTITYANLLSLYNAAKTALSAKGQSPSFTLGSFQNALLKANHGIGVVEKVVGQLENTCPTHFSSNRSSAFDANFASFGNNANKTFYASNFSSFGNNGFKSGFYASNFSSFGNNANKAFYSSNFSSFGNNGFKSGFFSSNFSSFGNNGNKAFYSSNFSGFGNGGNCGFFGSNFSGFGNFCFNSGYGFTFNYQVFHYKTGSKATVHSGNNKANYFAHGNSGNCAQYGGNFGTFGNGGNCAQYGSNFSSFGNSGNNAQHSANFSSFGNSGNNAQHSANFSSFGNSGNNSQNSANFSSFGNSGNNAQHSSNFSSFGNHANRTALYSGNFSAVTKGCYVVHSTFRVQGVDF